MTGGSINKGWEEASVSNRGALTPGDAHFVFSAKAGAGIQTIVRSRMVNAAHQTVRGFLPTQERRGGRGEGGEVDAKSIIKAPGTTLQGPRPGRNFWRKRPCLAKRRLDFWYSPHYSPC